MKPPPVTNNLGLHPYHDNRSAQLKWVRAFIDLALQRLADSPAYVLGARELARAGRGRPGN